jgi:hypothetical protein
MQAKGNVFLNFDSMPLGAVGNQYASQGVMFSNGFTATNSTGGGIVLMPSAPNYITLDHTVGTGKVTFVSPTDSSVEATTSFVTLSTVGLANSGGFFNGMQISALNLQGVQVASATIAPVGPTVAQAATTITLAGVGINSLVFTIIPNPVSSTALAPTDNWTVGPLTAGQSQTASPEPASFGVLAAGVGMLLRRRRRV